MFNNDSFNKNLVKTKSITVPVSNGEEYLRNLSESSKRSVTQPSLYPTVDSELSSSTQVILSQKA